VSLSHGSGSLGQLARDERTLGPDERAVFVSREVFDVPYDEIAEAVGKSSAAVRQIAHRARRHVAARRPRMEVSHTEQQEVVERFLAALTTGDVQGLMDGSPASTRSATRTSSGGRKRWRSCGGDGRN
jgi:hypothetical protein